MPESSGSAEKADADRLLKQRIGEVASGRRVGPERATIADLCVLVIEDNQFRKLRDAEHVAWRYQAHIKPVLGHLLASRFGSAQVRQYVAQRRAAGASDATINRHGIRMGTSELYRAVEDLPEVLDSLVVDLEYLGRESYMPLFVVLRTGISLTPELTATIRQRIKVALSARHVPNEVIRVDAVPRTLSGKKMELPIKKLLMGQPLESVANPDTMANPESLAWYAAFARDRATTSHPAQA